MHKLTNMEAQRVISVLEDAVERLSLISLIPITPNHVLFTHIDDPLLTGATQQLWQIEERRKILANSHSNTGPFESDINDLSAQLVGTIHKICLNLMRNVKASCLLKSCVSPTPTLTGCQRYLSDLTAVTFRQLSTTVEEGIANAHMLQELTEKERSAAEEAAALRQNLETRRAEYSQEVSALAQTLAKMRAELHDIIKKKQAKTEIVSSQMEDQITRSKVDHASTTEQLASKTSLLETSLEAERQSNRDIEATLRKKKERLEADLAAQVDKYDVDMAAILHKTERIKELMVFEREMLRELEEYFSKIDANQKRKQEEVEVLKALGRRLFHARKLLDDAATNAQKMVRGKQLRVFIRQLQNKRNKKGKGGKSKKKN